MVNPTESKTEQRALRRPVEHAGRLLELIGNDKPRWMVATLVFKRTKPGVSAGSFVSLIDMTVGSKSKLATHNRLISDSRTAGRL